MRLPLITVLFSGLLVACGAAPPPVQPTGITRVFHTIEGKAFSLACHHQDRGWDLTLCRDERRPGDTGLFATTPQGLLKPKCVPPTPSSSVPNTELLRPLFLELGSIKSEPLVVNDAVSIDVDGDGRIEELIVAESTTKKGPLTAIIVLKSNRLRVVATFDTPTTYRVSKGVCTDADGDRIPELLLEYFEDGDRGYELMEWDGRGLRQVGFNLVSPSMLGGDQ